MTIKLPTMQIKPEAVRWFNALLRKAQTEGYVSEKVRITPARAAILLSRNPDNRSIRDAKAAQYISDMTEGRWHFNGETIIIADNGLLNDGQHRLYASLKSGKSFDTIIVLGVARETRSTIDTGAAKSAGDHLSFDGVPNALSGAAIARYVAAWRSEGILKRRGAISAQQQIEIVKNDPLIQEIAAWVDSQKYRMKDMLRGALSGFIFYLLAEKAPREAKIFMDQLRLGAGLDSHSPIFLAREKLRQKAALSDLQRIETVVRAWNHWCLSPTTTISRLQIMDTVPEIKTPRWQVREEGDFTDTLAIPHTTKKKEAVTA